MTSTRTTSRRLIAVTLAAAGAAGLTACGSSKHTGQQASTGKGSGIAFSQCMRSHGVSNFPDPTSGSGGGIQIPSGSGIKPFSPAFRAAQTDCQKLLPGGGPGRGQSSGQRKEQLVRLAECMRQHGISSFPDPTSSPPTSPPSGGGIAFGSPGAFISVPQSLIQSPGFQADAKACGFPGGGPGGPGGPGRPGPGQASIDAGKK